MANWIAILPAIGFEIALLIVVVLGIRTQFGGLGTIVTDVQFVGSAVITAVRWGVSVGGWLIAGTITAATWVYAAWESLIAAAIVAVAWFIVATITAMREFVVPAAIAVVGWTLATAGGVITAQIVIWWLVVAAIIAGVVWVLATVAIVVPVIIAAVQSAVSSTTAAVVSAIVVTITALGWVIAVTALAVVWIIAGIVAVRGWVVEFAVPVTIDAVDSTIASTIMAVEWGDACLVAVVNWVDAAIVGVVGWIVALQELVVPATIAATGWVTAAIIVAAGWVVAVVGWVVTAGLTNWREHLLIAVSAAVTGAIAQGLIEMTRRIIAHWPRILAALTSPQDTNTIPAVDLSPPPSVVQPADPRPGPSQARNDRIPTTTRLAAVPSAPGSLNRLAEDASILLELFSQGSHVNDNISDEYHGIITNATEGVLAIHARIRQVNQRAVPRGVAIPDPDCIICYAEIANMVFLPCKHLVVCTVYMSSASGWSGVVANGVVWAVVW